MGKIAGSSWLNVVKKAFRSPTEDNKKRSSRREEHEQVVEEEKKRGKRRWIFRKSSLHETTIHHNEGKNISSTATTSVSTSAGTSALSKADNDDQRRAIAVAMATTAAAEAAVATAQAAVEVFRLTRPSIFVREHYAAIIIQATFRGYLARRALRALKGLVKLQALIRGHNVRKRAETTLRCIQSLVRAQARVRDERKRLSFEGSTVSSEPNSLWESHLVNRKSISRDGSSITDEWDGHPRRVEEIEVMLQKTKEAALKREKTLAHAFSHQMWRSGRSGKDQFEANEEQESKPIWFDRATTKQWESMGRTSCDQRDPIKTVEIDAAQSYSYSAPNLQRSKNQYYHSQQKPHSHSVSSPVHRTQKNLFVHSPITPSPIKTKPLQVHSASPRCLREERIFLTAWTPTLGSTYYQGMGISGNAGAAPSPNYMAATASTKARIRSQSAPRQRSPERGKMGSAKKRLSFPVPDPFNGVVISNVHSDHNMMSLNEDRFGAEQMSNMSSYRADNLGCEISPPSTSDTRRWFR